MVITDIITSMIETRGRSECRDPGSHFYFRGATIDISRSRVIIYGKYNIQEVIPDVLPQQRQT
jgi:hypothetical protein